MTQTTLTITAFEPRHRQAVDDLIFRNFQVHTHLDWHEIDEWLEKQQTPVRLAWQDRKLVGILAASNTLNRTCWIRVAAVQDSAPTQTIMCALWDSLYPELAQYGSERVSMLITRDWVEQQARALGFEYDEDIITLRRIGESIPTSRFSGVTFRPATAVDLDPITQIDHDSFIPPWQMTRDEIQQALRVATLSSVALRDDRIVGYQISTIYRDGAHLARLAVTPQAQGQGIGGSILSDALRRFFKRGIYSMTVNTQMSNHRSQHLYRHFGFQRNGYDLGVWSKGIL
jgi:ribosomal protein S18 acetylase RimI-like enzyme